MTLGDLQGHSLTPHKTGLTVDSYLLPASKSAEARVVKFCTPVDSIKS